LGATVLAAALLLSATACTAQDRPQSTSAPASAPAAGEAEAASLMLPEPAWLVALSTGVMIAGGGVLVTWLAIRRKAAFALPPLAKGDGRRITAVQALGGVCLWLLLGLLLSQLAAQWLGVDTKALETASPRRVVWMLAAGSVGQGLAVVGILWLLRAGSQVRAADLGIRADGLARSLGVGALVFLVVYPACYGVHWVILELARLSGHVPKLHVIIDQAMRFGEPWYRKWLTAIAVGVAPLMEEFFFRGFLQTFFRQQMADRRMAVFLAAGAFALVHFGNWDSMPPLFVLGLGLGWAYEKTGRLAAPVIGHVLFNGMTMLRFY
jgi:membrane protease YdiL (CAAX protease family)